ncbi:hypothetical protein GCM10009559_60340 [Pseudonocardia zijingensis]|uniref:Uncharacterized protein n=1 Tax=Pseudonocardia zijingensis TaxID=153376 RepID=A0ABP3YLQ8_9PSEU
MGVVDVLEAVEVDQGHGVGVAGRGGADLGQPHVECAAVRQPGERVLQRLRGDGAVLAREPVVLGVAAQRGVPRLPQRPQLALERGRVELQRL